MTDRELDELMRLLDDHSLEGERIDERALRAAVMAIPDRVGVPPTPLPSPARPRNRHAKDVILVCSGGGHLEQLLRLERRLPLDGPRRWITFESEQSRSLLSGEDVEFVPEVNGADYRSFTRSLLTKAKLVGSSATTAAVISSGSSIALAYLPYSAVRRIPTYYIESATCLSRPSLTGRVLELVPGVSLLKQTRTVYGPKWSYCGSVLDEFRPIAGSGHPVGPTRPTRVVVSLGLNPTYGFTRLLVKLQELLAGPQFDVTWQVGNTPTTGLRLDGCVTALPHHEFRSKVSEADVVVAHAGAGIALTAISTGRLPLLVPRDPVFREFKDDGQRQIAAAFASAGLAVTTTVEGLDLETIEAARRSPPVRTAPAGSLRLDRTVVRYSAVA